MKQTKIFFPAYLLMTYFKICCPNVYAVAPASFEVMYNTAANENINSLRNAIHRGLNINYPNKNGDTGICVAIKKKDYKAYNTFILAGANAQPDCLYSIPQRKYEKFMKSDKIVLYKRNQYTPDGNPRPARGGNFAPRYISDTQMNIVQKELNYTAQTGNAYNLLYLPVQVILSLFP